MKDKINIGIGGAAVLTLLITASSSGRIDTVAGVCAGALVSLVVARFYHRRASEELKREAGKLRHYIDALISYLEEAGLIIDRRTADDTPIRIRPGTARSSPRASARAESTLTHPQDPQQARGDQPYAANPRPLAARTTEG